MALRIRRGLEADRLSVTPDEGEYLYCTDTKLLYIGDGTTAGGNLISGAGAVVTASDTANIDLTVTGNDLTADLTDTTVTPSTYGDATNIPQITVDQKGRVTSVTDIPVSIPSGTVTSVGLTMPSAFTVANSPITSSGDIAVTGAGLVSQYVRGDGSLANFPTSTGGGSSVNYYLNGSVNQGTFGGVTYYEMNRTPILGLGTNFTLTNTNNYIASFLTDAGDPNQLNIPAGNWNCELYFNVSNNSGTPSFYIELYKYDGVTFTLIASSSTNPEFITNGTQVDLYTTAIPVPQTTLLATDRLAVRVHVNTSGSRTVTLHTEDNNLCQVITTFSTGLTALNGLTDQVQNLAVGTSGTDFAISSLTDTHTFNLPTASALNRGALSSADWSTFNGKVNTGLITSSGLTMNTALLLGRGTIGVGAVEEIVIGSGLTLTGTTLSAAGSGITIGTTAIASGTVGRVLFEGAGNVVQQSSNFFWDNTNGRLGIRVATPTASLEVLGAAASGTTQAFAIHNSTGNNNALVVRDDGFVGIGTTTPQTIGVNNSVALRIVNGGNNYLSLFTTGGVLLGKGSTTTTFGGAFTPVSIGNNNTGRDNFVAIGNANTAINSICIGSNNLFSVGTNIAIGSNNNNQIEGYTTSNTNLLMGWTNSVRSSAGIIAIGLENGSHSGGGSNLGGAVIDGIFIGKWIRQGAIADTTTVNSINLGWGVSNASPARPAIVDAFSLYFKNTERSFFVNKNSNVVLRSLQALTAGTQYDSNATNTFTIHNGTAPASNIADAFQLYSADIVAGNASPHFRTENGDVVRLYRVGGWGLPTGAFTRTTFDTTTVTTQQLAERVAALIQDLRDNHQLLKA
jgi:hypothetical protein